jgi:hypothetical protein
MVPEVYLCSEEIRTEKVKNKELSTFSQGVGCMGAVFCQEVMAVSQTTLDGNSAPF